MAKILLVDDDEELARATQSFLELQGHIVERCHNGHDALQLVQAFRYDLVLLDWGLPGMDGDEVCRQYRQGGGEAPIIFLTGKNEVDNVEAGFAAGADDYIRKPFEARELASRIRARLRRDTAASSAEINVGNVILQPTTQTLIVGEQAIHLRAKEAALLEFLMRHADQTFSAQDLYEHVWKSDSESNSASVRTWMGLIRKKLEAAGAVNFVCTVLGAGYVVYDKGRP